MLKPSIVLSKLLSGEKVPRIRTRNSNWVLQSQRRLQPSWLSPERSQSVERIIAPSQIWEGGQVSEQADSWSHLPCVQPNTHYVWCTEGSEIIYNWHRKAFMYDEVQKVCWQSHKSEDRSLQTRTA
jgi:hypothetical protein